MLGGDWRQRQREASQPGSAPRADRRSSKQHDLSASSGKNRKATANGASPKRRCKICAHPDRAAIDAELLQGVSLRTVAGRHGLSVSTLYRHWKWHVDAPTVGDILPPNYVGGSWREWDGTRLQPIPRPRFKHLVQVKGRTGSYSWRTGWSDDGAAFSLPVFRRRRGK